MQYVTPMCGIVGVVQREPQMSGKDLHSINSAMSHRGPDDSGYVFVGDTTIEAFDYDTVPSARRGIHVDEVGHGWISALASRRLAILDTSHMGHQPMSNEDRTIWVVHNGEIYNFEELRRGLKGHEFSCDCDTEVIVHGYEEWGIAGLLSKLRGMWAFILLDVKKGLLYAVRDLVGIKPLYMFNSHNGIVLTSEVKALLPITKLRPNVDAVRKYITYTALEPHETFFEGVSKVPPSTYLEIDLKSLGMRRVKYWDVPSRIVDEKYGEAIRLWRDTFLESVRIHLRSDVPFAFLLSGGLDSASLIAAWHTLRNRGDLERWGKTNAPLAYAFCSGDEKDECRYADAIASEYGIELVKVRDINVGDAVREIAYYHDEPPGGPSVIAQWHVIREASRNVKVLISGQGGDEVLAGYQRYVYRYILSEIKRNPIHGVVELLRFLDVLLQKREWLFFSRKIGRTQGRNRGMGVADPVNALLVRDLMGDGLQRLLHYADRDGMAFSVEVRVPYLDRALIELALSLPGYYKLARGWTKRIHRDAMKGILIDLIRKRRDKVGFEVPEKEWLLAIRPQINYNDVQAVLSKLGVPGPIIDVLSNLWNKADKLKGPEANLLWRAIFLYYWYLHYFAHNS